MHERATTGHMHSIPMTIADVLFDVQSPLSARELGIEKQLGPFFGMPPNPAASAVVRWEESDSELAIPGQLVYNPGSIWRMYRDGPDTCAAFSYVDVGSTMIPQGILRANAAWNQLTLTERRTGAGWISLLNMGAGELALRMSILFADGLVFHASGIDDNGRTVVLVEHSGASKTTPAALGSRLPGVIARNDDCIAIRAEGEGALCYGMPWGGGKDIAHLHRAPLSAIVVLQQAPDNIISPLAPSAGVPMLLARTLLPYWDGELMGRAAANLKAILARVPVYLLHYRLETGVVALVRSVLQ